MESYSARLLLWLLTFWSTVGSKFDISKFCQNPLLRTFWRCWGTSLISVEQKLKEQIKQSDGPHNSCQLKAYDNFCSNGLSFGGCKSKVVARMVDLFMDFQSLKLFFRIFMYRRADFLVGRRWKLGQCALSSCLRKPSSSSGNKGHALSMVNFNSGVKDLWQWRPFSDPISYQKSLINSFNHNHFPDFKHVTTLIFQKKIWVCCVRHKWKQWFANPFLNSVQRKDISCSNWLIFNIL